MMRFIGVIFLRDFAIYALFIEFDKSLLNSIETDGFTDWFCCKISSGIKL